MNHSAMDHSSMDHSTMDHSSMDHSEHGSIEINFCFRFNLIKYFTLAGHSMDNHEHHLMQGKTDAPMMNHHDHTAGSMDHMMSMAVSNEIYKSSGPVIVNFENIFSSILDTLKSF